MPFPLTITSIPRPASVPSALLTPVPFPIRRRPVRQLLSPSPPPCRRLLARHTTVALLGTPWSK